MLHHNQYYQQIDSFIELSTVDSTNNYALKLIREPALTERQVEKLHGTAVFAHEQTSGKGQRGKKWMANSGENLQMSVIISPDKLLQQKQFLLSAIVALYIRDFFEKHSLNTITIKWPNDIYFQDKKAGGILIENIITGNEWKWAVVGIGLNINQTHFDPNLPNPVSMTQIAGKQFNCIELAKELHNGLLKNIEAFRLEDRRVLLKTYNTRLYKLGQRVRLKKDTRIFEAEITGVTDNGQLIVKHQFKEVFNFGSVEWVLH